MKNEKIEIILDDGTKKDGEVLFSFESNGDNFIMYEIDSEAYGAKIHEDGTLSKVYDDEWKLLEKMFNEFMGQQDVD